MTQSHTKGPWINQRGAIEANHRCIARVNEGYTTQAILESIANANLIAAAPDMLEALEKVCNGLYALRDHTQQVEKLSGSYEQHLIDECIRALNKTKGL